MFLVCDRGGTRCCNRFIMSGPPNDTGALAGSASISASCESLLSTASSTASRPSGLRQPSKIGRPCHGHQTSKPPVPQSPKANGTNSTIQKLSDDLARKKISADSSIVLTEDTDSFIIGDRVWVGGSKPGRLAYIGETQFAPGDWAGIVLDDPIGKNDGSVAGVRYFQCENKKGVFSRLTRLTRQPLTGGAPPVTSPVSPQTMPSTPRQTSSVTATPVTSHKLSTAGGMQHRGSISGGSATSPNASGGELKVGDRVIVMSSQGSKAGQLRYLGTTDFQTGVWCGVELDDPLGKNDGSVAGTRYFECLPNFGLFAPLHKVSRSPAGGRKSSTAAAAGCAMHPAGKMQSRKHAGSRESLNSNTTTASSIKSSASRVRLGVNSLAKTSSTPLRSTLRSSHIGGNDSAANDKTKSPLQELLREKQQHIEQLLKERDLERAEVTRAASQTEEAERKLADFKVQFLQSQEDAAKKLQRLQLQVDQLLTEKRDLLGQVEDERRRCEDMQFRFEEETFAKAEIQATAEKYEKQIRELEHSDRMVSESLESESNKLFEAEEALAKLLEDYDLLKAQSENSTKSDQNSKEESDKRIEQLQNEIKAKIEENAKANEVIKQLTETSKNNLELFENEKKLLKQQANKFEEEIEEIKKLLKLAEDDKIAFENTIKEMNEQQKKEAQVNEDKLKKLENELMTKEETWRTQLSEVENKSKETVNHLQQQSNSNKNEIEDSYKKQIEKLQSEFASEIEALREEKAVIGKDFNITKLKLEEILKEKENLVAEFKQNESSLKSDVEQLERDVTNLKKQFEKDREVLEDNVKKKETEISVLVDEKNRTTKDNLTLKEELDEKKKIEENLEKSELDLKNNVNKLEETVGNLMKQIAEEKEKYEVCLKRKDSELEALKDEQGNAKTENQKLDENLKKIQNDLEEKNAALKEMKSVLDKVESASNEKDRTIEELKAHISSVSSQLLSMKGEKESSLEQINKLELAVGDVNRQLKDAQQKCAQLTDQKLKLEDDLMNVMNTSSSSSEQLSKLGSDLRSKDSEIEKLREDAAEQLRQAQRNEQLFNQQLSQQTRVATELEASLSELREKSLKTQQQLNDKIESQSKQFNEQSDELKEEVVDLKNKLKESEENCHRIRKEHEESNKQSKLQLTGIEEESATKLKKIEAECNELKSKLESVLVSESNLKSLLEQEKSVSTTSEKELKTKVNVLEDELLQFKDKLKSSVEHEKQLEENNAKGVVVIEDLRKKVENLEGKLEGLVKEKDSLGEVVSSKTTQVDALVKDLEVLQNEKVESAKKLEMSEKLTKELKVEVEKVGKDYLGKEKECSELEMKVAEMVKRMELDRNSVNMTVGEKENKLKEVLSECESMKKDKMELEKKLVDSDLELASLKEVFERQNEVKAKLEAEVGTRISECNSLEEGLAKQKSDNVVLEKKLSETKCQLDDVGKKMEEVVCCLKEEKDNSSVLKNNVAKLQSELEVLLAEKIDKEKRLASSVADNSSKVVVLQKENEKLQEEVRKNMEKIKNDEVCLKELKKKIEDVSKEIDETERKTKGSKEEMKNEMKVVVEKFEKEREEDRKVRVSLEKTVDNFKSVVEGKEKLINKLEVELKALKIGGSSNNNNRENNNNVSKAVVNEEVESLTNQVSFLNSIIVDLQNKNEELKRRMEVMSQVNGSDELATKAAERRLPAPRLYCDICEEFDAHDTDDCPRQASDSPPLDQATSSQTPKYPRGYERPYCDICERFDHDTADCEEQDTY